MQVRILSPPLKFKDENINNYILDICNNSNWFLYMVSGFVLPTLAINYNSACKDDYIVMETFMFNNNIYCMPEHFVQINEKI